MQSQKESDDWLVFLKAVTKRLGQQATETWFKPLSVTRFSSRRIFRVDTPNVVIKDWILANYSNVVADCLTDSALDNWHLEWNVSSLEPQPDNGSSRHSSVPMPEERTHKIAASQGVLNKNQTPVARPAVLNANYTFDSFVVGPSNSFAHAAAKAVSDSPGKTYNPLYVYGPVGLGKTHLIQAIGQEIAARHPQLFIAYVSLERFMNELINAIRYGYDRTQEFRDKYRTIDVLLIDDIQFIAGKERTQEEFFHTFNSLYESQKQIVLTSDCSPREIPEIEERLHSRFEWGLIADIDPPELETKLAIIRRKAEHQRIDVPDDVALFLASACKHNIRELEGSLIRLSAIASMRGVPITITLAEETLGRDTTMEHVGKLSIRRVQEFVSAHFKLKLENLISRSNVRSVLFPRQIAMYLCKHLIGSSYPEIGRQFGGKHHTTVMHSVEKISLLMSTDSDLRNTVNRITEVLQRGTP